MRPDAGIGLYGLGKLTCRAAHRYDHVLAFDLLAHLIDFTNIYNTCLFCNIRQNSLSHRKLTMKNHASINRIYRLVWNAALSLWVAVAENARGRSKGGSGRSSVDVICVNTGSPVRDPGAGGRRPHIVVLHARCRAALGLIASLAFLGSQAHAADAANAAVVAGSGHVSTAGNTTTINQTTQRLAIDWTSLSTRANEALVFNQPNASAIALNRIIGSSPSELLGSLTANGQVFILNPNGVLFGAGSQVNVGGLVASTLNMSNADFMAGNHVFTNSGGTGSVINQGTLMAADGGYLALLAPEVRNEGVMTASLGTALLAAGNKVTLNLDNGSLLGYSIDQGAINALAENKQLIKADGGQVLLSAKAMDSLTTATVNNTGVIEAKTLQNKAGRILLMGDMEYGTVNVGGTLDASAPNGGDGGFIETSAARVKVADDVLITTKAAEGLGGQSGTWLIDPTDFTIAASGGDMTGAALSTQLGNNGTVTILNTQGASGTAGDININDSVNWSSNSVLTLTAGHNIAFNAAVTATGTNAGLVLNYGADYSVKAPVTLSGSNSSLSINGNAYTLIRSMAALDAIDSTGLSGRYALAQNLDASSTTYTDSLVAGVFSGTFAGLGHTISNLNITSSANSTQVGLFSKHNGILRDLGVVGGSVSGGQNVGGLVGQNYAGSISNAYSTANVIGSGSFVGGLVGYNQGSISNAYSTGSVNGASQTGGLVGNNNSSGTISNAYSTGTVSSGNYVGGLVGVNFGTGTISNAYSTGTVIGSGNYAGGLVGFNTGGTISNAYSTGAVSGGTLVGGLVGSNNGGTVNSSFWDTQTSGQTTSAGGTGKTTAEMRQASTFTSAGWSASNVGGDGTTWRIYEGNTGPLLRAFMTGQLTLANTSVTYNGSMQAGATTAVAGVSGSNVTARNAGSYLTGYYSGQQGYDIIGGGLNIARADLTLTTSDVVKTYDGSLSAIGTAAVTGGTQLFSNDAITGGSFAFTDKNAGSGNKTVTTSGVTVNDGNSGNNYNVSYANNTTSTINKASLLLKASDVTKTYDGGLSAIGTAVLTGGTQLFSTDAITGGSFAFTDKNAGSGNKTVTTSGVTVNDGNGGNNYNVSYANNTTSTINKANVTLSTANVTKTYDGGLAAAGTATATVGTVFTGDSLSGGTFAFTDKNAGNGNKTVTTSGVTVNDGNGGNNYNVSYANNTTSTINKASLTVSGITASDKIYNASDAATVSTAGASYSGLFAGDVVNVAATGLFSDKNAGSNKTVNLSSSYSGADVGNYAITNQATTTASISQAALTVSGITASDKIYNATDAATVSTAGASYSGLFAGDVVNVAATGLFSDKNVGVGKTVTLSSSYTGADAGNYAITNQATTTASISQAALTVSGITAADKTYNASDAATVSTAGASYSGLFAGDVVNVAATGLFGDKNVGVGKTVTLSSSYTGADAGNYAITNQASTTATISQASLTVGSGNVTKTYDGNLSAAGSAIVTGGTLFAGDSLSGGTFAFTDKNASAGDKVVNVSGVTVGDGIHNANYNVTYASNTNSTINKANLTVTATGVNKVYDGTTAAPVGYGDNRVAGDVLGITGTAAFADKNAGLGKTVSVSGISTAGADAGNYTLLNTSASTTASITPKALTVTANDDSKNYNGTPYSGGNGVRYSGFVAGDTLADIGGLLAYGGSSQGAVAAGSYLITPGGLNSLSGNYALGFASGALSITALNASAAALGNAALVKSYDSALQTLAGLGGASGGVGGGFDGNGDVMAAALAAAAAEAGNTDEK